MTSTRVAHVMIKLSLFCKHSSCVHWFVYLHLFHLPAMNWIHCHVPHYPIHELKPLSCATLSHPWTEATVMCHTVPSMNWSHCHVPCWPSYELNSFIYMPHCSMFPITSSDRNKRMFQKIRKQHAPCYITSSDCIFHCVMGIHRLSAATIWHHKHVVSPNTKFTDGRPTGNIINVAVCSVTWLCMWRVLHCRKFITSWLGCTQHVVSQNHVWIQCRAFSKGMTCWGPAMTWLPTHEHYRCKCVSCRCHYQIREVLPF